MANTLPDQELAKKVEALVERGDINRGDPVYGVALNAIDLGYDRLTRAQRNLYDRVLVPALKALDEGQAPAVRSAPVPAPVPGTAAARAFAPARGLPEAGGWRPIREAPEDRDVQLAMMVDGKPSPLAFACRRAKRAWVQSASGKPVYFRPSHWREWPG
ncbi:MAG TPA: hypothetical protein VFK86_19925 [Bauldia sp.]|nr:hypothetical protein [Bauldia sp.]